MLTEEFAMKQVKIELEDAIEALEGCAEAQLHAGMPTVPYIWLFGISNILFMMNVDNK